MSTTPPPAPTPQLPLDAFNTLRRIAPLVSIDLLIEDAQHRILVGLRKNEPAKDTWFVPGGRINKDERLAAAFARILHFELDRPADLGLSTHLADARFLGVYEHLYPATSSTPFSIHYVVLGYHLTAHNPASALDPANPAAAQLPASQHAHWRWLTIPALLADPQVHPNVKAYFPTSTPR